MTQNNANSTTQATIAEKPKKGFSIGVGKFTIIASAVIVTLGYFVGNSCFEHQETAKTAVNQEADKATKVLEKTNTHNSKEQELKELNKSVIEGIFEKTKDSLSICRDMELEKYNCLTSDENEMLNFYFSNGEDVMNTLFRITPKYKVDVTLYNKKTKNYVKLSTTDVDLHGKLMSIYNNRLKDDKSRFLNDKINELKNLQTELNDSK